MEDLEKQKKLQFENVDDNLWLLFAGDKGGKHMKFHFEVIDYSNAGSVYNVDIFAMYEGSDSHSNMALVLPKFYEAIERLESEEFSLIGHKVKVFLGGDYHFLDDCLGHQGSAATCPSSKDLVTLDIVYRNTWLGNNFRYLTNMLKIKSRGKDRAQYFNVNQI